MNLSNTILDRMTLQFVGNKSQDGKLICTDAYLPLQPELRARLTRYYLHKFDKVPERYRFYHATSLRFNEMYHFIGEIFANHDRLGELSKEIATHLFEKSVHPNIKPGELHIGLFTGCVYKEETVAAIGIFKTESRAGYLEVDEQKTSLLLQYKEGLDLNKFEKGCLIFDVQREEGFEIAVIDNQNKTEEARYWMDEFLGLLQISNEFSQTSQLLTLTKNYITGQYGEDFEISRTDQIDLLNRSIDYFKSRDQFSKQEFEEEVFHHPEIIQSFRQFGQQYTNTNEMDIHDNFDISSQAVKKQSRIFKSVLKLDNNFHIYIHGNRQMIEKGIDQDGRKYYKIYFEEER